MRHIVLPLLLVMPLSSYALETADVTLLAKPILYSNIEIGTCHHIPAEPPISLNAEKDQGVFCFDAEGICLLNATFDFRGHNLTSLCMLKNDDDFVKGSVINEFGVKAFDFEFNKAKRKCKLLNVMPFLNKWYIKRVIRQDLAFLLTSTSPQENSRRSISKTSEGEVVLRNLRQRLTYTFTPLHNDSIEQ